jgi:hypothetical protein
MNFIDYLTSPFPNLNNSEEIILQSSFKTLYVNSITICNVSVNDIRINLVKRVIGSDASQKDTFMVKNLLVSPITSLDKDSKSTVNLISLYGLDIFLPSNTINEVVYNTQLICYSHSATQKFDCTVDYSVFVETPII